MHADPPMSNFIISIIEPAPACHTHTHKNVMHVIQPSSYQRVEACSERGAWLGLDLTVVARLGYTWSIHSAFKRGGGLRARNVEQVAHLDVVAPGVEGEPLPDQRHLLLRRP